MTRSHRSISPWLLVAALSLCGCPRSDTPSVAAAGLPLAEASRIDGEAVSGVYRVTGVTVQAATGLQRAIGGSVELGVEGGRYRVSFDLDTTDPDAGEEVHVRGTGLGFVVGDILTGTTEEWMSLAVPVNESAGVPLPRRAGRKIVSSSQGSFDEDGSFHIVLQNQPAPGERYTPSVTVLTGLRAD